MNQGTGCRVYPSCGLAMRKGLVNRFNPACALMHRVLEFALPIVIGMGYPAGSLCGWPFERECLLLMHNAGLTVYSDRSPTVIIRNMHTNLMCMFLFPGWAMDNGADFFWRK